MGQRHRTHIRVTLACVVASLLVASAALADAGRAGHPDPSFDGDGKVVVGQAHGFANAVDVGPSGRIVVAGSHGVVRLLPNGRLDRPCADGGVANLASGAYATQPSSVAAGPSSVAIGRSGRIFVAGTSCSVAIDPRDRIVGAGPHQRHGRKRFGVVRLLG